MTSQPSSRSRARGCLLGGALGDALGASIEFDSIESIRRRFGPEGLTGLASAYGLPAAITDDTQMTLFTAEGLIAAARAGTDPVAEVATSYQRWLRTQGEDAEVSDSWLLQRPELHHRRAPGNTCLAALRAPGRDPLRADNDSKGCGGVMRAAPAGILGADPFALGCAVAAITHGHPSGIVSAGALASMVSVVFHGGTLADAVDATLADLARAPDHDEVTDAIAAAIDLARDEPVPSPEIVARLGEGWVAEEALAIGLYCALTAEDVARALLASVNHSGDSDSTGSITGNILGAMHGEDALPQTWLTDLDARSIIERIADELSDAAPSS